MDLNVLVAESSGANWQSIAKGIRNSLPHASVLRVKDGEQAIRFLFHQGLLTDHPPIPDLVLLGDDLPVISAERVLERLRQHPRTCATPVIMLRSQSALANIGQPDTFPSSEPALTMWGTEALEARIAEAVCRLSGPHAQVNGRVT